jgi:adenylosuccinate lyase
MNVWDGKTDSGEPAFLTHLKADAEITRHLDAAALAALFDESAYTRHVETIFSRVFHS